MVQMEGQAGPPLLIRWSPALVPPPPACPGPNRRFLGAVVLAGIHARTLGWKLVHGSHGGCLGDISKQNKLNATNGSEILCEWRRINSIEKHTKSWILRLYQRHKGADTGGHIPTQGCQCVDHYGQHGTRGPGATLGFWTLGIGTNFLFFWGGDGS